MLRIAGVIFMFLVVSCRFADETELTADLCSKKISYESHQFSNEILKLNIKHEGFCIDAVDKIEGVCYRMMNTDSILDSTFFVKSSAQSEFSKNSETGTISFNLNTDYEHCKFVRVKFPVHYINYTQSNVIERVIKTPCTKKIHSPETYLISEQSCETNAGTGDRHGISFLHDGFCIEDIDSVHIKGIFIDEYNDEVTVSEVSKPRNQLVIVSDDSYTADIDCSVCITFNFSIKVHTLFYVVYRDGSVSNTQEIDIFNTQTDKNNFNICTLD